MAAKEVFAFHAVGAEFAIFEIAAPVEVTTVEEIMGGGNVVAELHAGGNGAAIEAVFCAHVEVGLDDVTTIFRVTGVEAHVAIFAVINVVAGAGGGVVLVSKHARDLALELFKFGIYVLKHFGIGETEIFHRLFVALFRVGLVENIEFFVAQACTAGTIFTTSQIIGKADVLAIGAILTEIAVITGVAVDTFVAKLAAFAESAVGAVGEGA